MSIITIKNAQFELDLLDADQAEKMENAVAKVIQEMDALSERTESNDETLSNADVVREACHIVFACFNSLFGEGADKKIFGERTHFGECLEAFAQLQEQAQQNSTNDLTGILSRYQPATGREQRGQAEREE